MTTERPRQFQGKDLKKIATYLGHHLLIKKVLNSFKTFHFLFDSIFEQNLYIFNCRSAESPDLKKAIASQISEFLRSEADYTLERRGCIIFIEAGRLDVFNSRKHCKTL